MKRVNLYMFCCIILRKCVYFIFLEFYVLLKFDIVTLVSLLINFYFKSDPDTY